MPDNIDQSLNLLRDITTKPKWSAPRPFLGYDIKFYDIYLEEIMNWLEDEAEIAGFYDKPKFWVYFDEDCHPTNGIKTIKGLQYDKINDIVINNVTLYKLEYNRGVKVKDFDLKNSTKARIANSHIKFYYNYIRDIKAFVTTLRKTHNDNFNDTPVEQSKTVLPIGNDYRKVITDDSVVFNRFHSSIYHGEYICNAYDASLNSCRPTYPCIIKTNDANLLYIDALRATVDKQTTKKSMLGKYQILKPDGTKFIFDKIGINIFYATKGPHSGQAVIINDIQNLIPLRLIPNLASFGIGTTATILGAGYNNIEYIEHGRSYTVDLISKERFEGNSDNANYVALKSPDTYNVSITDKEVFNIVASSNIYTMTDGYDYDTDLDLYPTETIKGPTVSKRVGGFNGGEAQEIFDRTFILNKKGELYSFRAFNTDNIGYTYGHYHFVTGGIPLNVLYYRGGITWRLGYTSYGRISDCSTIQRENPDFPFFCEALNCNEQPTTISASPGGSLGTFPQDGDGAFDFGPFISDENCSPVTSDSDTREHGYTGLPWDLQDVTSNYIKFEGHDNYVPNSIGVEIDTDSPKMPYFPYNFKKLFTFDTPEMCKGTTNLSNGDLKKDDKGDPIQESDLELFFLGLGNVPRVKLYERNDKICFARRYIRHNTFLKSYFINGLNGNIGASTGFNGYWLHPNPYEGNKEICFIGNPYLTLKAYQDSLEIEQKPILTNASIICHGISPITWSIHGPEQGMSLAFDEAYDTIGNVTVTNQHRAFTIKTVDSYQDFRTPKENCLDNRVMKHRAKVWPRTLPKTSKINADHIQNSIDHPSSLGYGAILGIDLCILSQTFVSKDTQWNNTVSISDTNILFVNGLFPESGTYISALHFNPNKIPNDTPIYIQGGEFTLAGLEEGEANVTFYGNTALNAKDVTFTVYVWGVHIYTDGGIVTPESPTRTPIKAGVLDLTNASSNYSTWEYENGIIRTSVGAEYTVRLTGTMSYPIQWCAGNKVGTITVDESDYRTAKITFNGKGAFWFTVMDSSEIPYKSPIFRVS